MNYDQFDPLKGYVSFSVDYPMKLTTTIKRYFNGKIDVEVHGTSYMTDQHVLSTMSFTHEPMPEEFEIHRNRIIHAAVSKMVEEIDRALLTGGKS